VAKEFKLTIDLNNHRKSGVESSIGVEAGNAKAEAGGEKVHNKHPQ
jgi:hypothetical protein